MQPVLLTTNGVAGACHAAIALMAMPEAHIRITSPRHIADALREEAESAHPIRQVFVCGMGFDVPLQEVQAALAALVKHTPCTWIAGREYPAVSKLAQVRIKGLKVAADANAPTVDVLRRTLKVTKSAQTLLLTALVEDAAAERKPASERHRRLHDAVLAANRRFYFFGADDLNEAVIRHLAGLAPFTEGLERAVEEYRKSDDATLPLGSSKAMKEIRRLVGKMGPIDEPVLIHGPTGSGKEVVARALHLTSGRCGPFVAVNCAVLGGNPLMVEDRLFGHVKGAFTGADRASRGAFDEADGGTLFLDEIAELAVDVQSQLLRILEEKRVRPLGTMETHLVNTRIVAATHRDLRAMIEDGAFREDLYYRLDVLRLDVPPLRDRPEDLRSIVAHECGLLEEAGHALKLSRTDWEALRTHDWPGNVRELRNVLRRAAYLGQGIAGMFTSTGRNGHSVESQSNTTLAELIRTLAPADEVRAEYIRQAYQRLGNNLQQTARQLALAPNTVRKTLQKGFVR
jgi:DNA-binding NtrC family response regulator